MKKLEEMNLVDDFLVYSLTAHKIYGEESARYILECILQRSIRHLTVLPQKTWYGENQGSHGVRLDVYLDEEEGEIFDVEPDQNGGSEDVKALPRRARFYHAKIDAGNLTAGEKYGNLRNVVVIFIITYDPFGLNRMLYTIRNGCVEAPELPYEDGARTVFLYTRGKEGNPPEELKNLTKYMEHSVEENVKTDGLARLHKMVTEVKSDRKVGLAYMKMWESEEAIRARVTAEVTAEVTREVTAEVTREVTREVTAEVKASDIICLLEKQGAVSEEDRERILAERNMEVLNGWYEDALADNESYLVRKAKAETVCLLLADLGPITEALKARIFSETELPVLDDWIRAAKRAEELEQFTSLLLPTAEGRITAGGQ